MIEERYLQTAVKIRKDYLKTSVNLEFYHRKAKDLVNNLESILEKIEKLSKEIEDDRKKGTSTHTKESVQSDLLKILQDLEKEGKSVEELANPMNKEIEKLALEEQELYRQIKEKYKDISDDELIKIVKDRLQIEGLL